MVMQMPCRTGGPNHNPQIRRYGAYGQSRTLGPLPGRGVPVHQAHRPLHCLAVHSFDIRAIVHFFAMTEG
jgi:hypothetical protein